MLGPWGTVRVPGYVHKEAAMAEQSAWRTSSEENHGYLHVVGGPTVKARDECRPDKGREDREAKHARVLYVPAGKQVTGSRD